ncbi:MAG: hypothetical protein HQL23_06395 [Candidatus Omnitrophica bacterium]|nr:hypothetical protein [Candidatus Omnitrophota bacterium]
MNKHMCFWSMAASFCLAATLAYAQQQDITLTTYYPAPFGIYKNLRLVPTGAAPTCDVNQTGVVYNDTTLGQEYCTGASGIWETVSPWVSNKTTNIVYPKQINAGVYPNVGIGTNNPQTPLQVNGTVRVEDPTNATCEIQTGAAGATIGTTTNHPLNFTTNNNFAAPQMVLTTAGNLGIGVQNPAQPLDVSQTIQVSNTGAGTSQVNLLVNNGGQILFTLTADPATGALNIARNNVTALSIDQNGDIRVAHNLYISGALLRIQTVNVGGVDYSYATYAP